MSTTTKPLPTVDEPDFLAGLRVLELGDRLAVGACGTLLAQLGAKVVLVEPASPHNSGKWVDRARVAAGKRSIVIDRASPEGAAELAALRDQFDIVLLSSDTDPHDLALWRSLRHPSQILCDITAFGHRGPLAGRGGSEAMVQAYSAVAETMGDADGPPSLIGAPILDMEAAVYAASAILAARRVQRTLGFGQRVEVCLYDVGINALLTFIPLYMTGRTAKRNGNRHPTLVPWNAYRARDGWVCICGPTDDQWGRVCALMGANDLVADPRFATTTARMENVSQVDALLAQWAANLTVEDCVGSLARANIPGGTIVSLDKLHEERNLVQRQAIQALNDPVSGRIVRVPSCPVRVRGRAPMRMSIPMPDEHRAEILRDCAPRHDAHERFGAESVPGGRALDGIRVVEIGMNTVAPLACRQLGALGADVVKVEPPTGDTNRWNAPVHECGESYIYALSNADKRGVVLNLRNENDRAVLFEILATTDMVIENLKPGSLDKLGVGPLESVKRFPHLIYCSVNGFGNESAYPGRPALDTVIQGMAGVMGASVINGVPTKAGISVSDQLGGQFSLLAMLAALERQEATGSGASFDIAMQDCSAWATQSVWDGNAAPECAIHATADGYVAIEGTQERIREVLQLPPDADIGSSVAQISRDEAVARLALGEGVDCAPVLAFSEVMNHRHLVERGLLLERSAPDGRQWTLLDSPMRLEATPAQVRSAMAHLGFSDETLAREFQLPMQIQLKSTARHTAGTSTFASSETTNQEKS